MDGMILSGLVLGKMGFQHLCKIRTKQHSLENIFAMELDGVLPSTFTLLLNGNLLEQDKQARSKSKIKIRRN